MTRRQAADLIKRIYGTDSASKALDRLQSAGLVSDEAIEPKDVATQDLIAAARKLGKRQV